MKTTKTIDSYGDLHVSIVGASCSTSFTIPAGTSKEVQNQAINRGTKLVEEREQLRAQREREQGALKARRLMIEAKSFGTGRLAL